MPIVHIMTGLPASGKTTYARTLDAMRFNLDDYRAMMWSTEWSREKEHAAVSALIASAKTSIALGHDIVIDNTHLTPSLPKTYRKEFARLGVTFKVHSFLDVPIDECIRRDEIRPNRVGKEVIHKLNNNYEKASKNGWRLTDEWMNGDPYVAPEPYVQDDSLPPAFVVDLDGTLALHDGIRDHYDYDNVIKDQPNSAVIETTQRLVDTGLIVLFCSGREDRCRDDTMSWLEKYVPLEQSRVGGLFMRMTGDHRSDDIIKGELFDAHIRSNFNVRFIFDDRDRVVAMWRNLGIPCYQVAPGNF